MGGKPRKNNVPKNKNVPTGVGGLVTQSFSMVDVNDASLTIKVVLERPAGQPVITASRISGVSLKRIGSAVAQKTPGGAKMLGINIIYKDST